MKSVINISRRLAGLLMFAVIGLPLMVVAVITLISAGLCWLVAGPSEARTDRILLNPVLGFIAELPFRVMGTLEAE